MNRLLRRLAYASILCAPLASCEASDASDDPAGTPIDTPNSGDLGVPDADVESIGAAPTTTDPAVDHDPESAPREPEEPKCALVGPPAATEGETLVWSDEFDGSSVDRTKWYVHDGYEGHGTIVNTFSPSAVTVHDGSLHVAVTAGSNDPAHPFTSGRLETFARFSRTYGKVEMRAKFAYAPGVWFAIWARQAHAPMPELDFEVLGNDASQAWLVNHWDIPPLPADDRRKYVVAKTNVAQFHTYAIVWKPSLVEWQVDGQTLMSSTTKGVPTAPIGWTINGWVGGWGASKTPAVPTEFEVDWMRVYRLDGVIAEPTVRVLNARSAYARTDSIVVDPANFDEACFVVDVYEGTHLLGTLRRWPYRFETKNLAVGTHELTFVATDGLRSASATASFAVN